MAGVRSSTVQEVKGVARGEYSLVYFTPELILESRYRRKILLTHIYKTRVKAFVVDEAHCVKN